MSYLVLARKWRPQRFEDVVGQEAATRILQNAIISGRVAHAYLFTGVRGVGKTTAARILAKALNCEHGPTPSPCGECANCAEIAGGSSIDVYEIDGASNRGIDEVRQIIENVRYQPAKSRFKIYIIDEVHQVTKDAFNALLKTLEEPPPFVKFILATTEPQRLPETILSRCQRLDFRRISVREIVRRLERIAQAEQLEIAAGALLLIAREAEGSMRDAESLLEQVLAYAAPCEGGERIKVDEALLHDILGVAARGALYDLSKAVIEGDANRGVEIVAELASQGRDLVRLSRELVEHFRNLLVARLAVESKGDGADLSRLLDLPDQEIEELKRQVEGLSVENLMDYFRFMADGDEEIARLPYPRFALEAALVRLAALPRSLPVVELLERLEGLEKRLEGKGAAVRPQRAGEKSVERKPDPQIAPASPARPQDQPEAWREFVAFVAKEKKFLASYLEKARPLELPPKRLTIEVDDRHQLSYLQDPDHLSSLEDLARRFFATEVKASVVCSASKAGGPDSERESFRELPRGEGEDKVEEVLKIFGGSIREIKRE